MTDVYLNLAGVAAGISVSAFSIALGIFISSRAIPSPDRPVKRSTR